MEQEEDFEQLVAIGFGQRAAAGDAPPGIEVFPAEEGDGRRVRFLITRTEAVWVDLPGFRPVEAAVEDAVERLVRAAGYFFTARTPPPIAGAARRSGS